MTNHISRVSTPHPSSGVRGQWSDVVAKPRGAAAIITVVVVGAATLILALSAGFLGLGELESAYVSQQGSEALAVADSCMEETMRRMRRLDTYGVAAGTINLTLSNGTCTIDVTDTGSLPETRTVVVTGTTDVYHKKIQTTLTFSTATTPTITVNTWSELDS